MYKIIGSDQKEYGPVSGDELRQWILDGRVNAQTRVEVDGQWKTIGEVPEFAGLLAQRRPAPTAAAPSAAPAGGGGSGMAISSLVLGILSIVTCGLVGPIAAPLGLVFGILAMNKSKKNNGAGWGLALSGTIVSGCALVLMIPLGAAMFLPAIAKARVNANTVRCMNNEKQLSLAMHLYSSDHNDQFPPAATWCDAIKPSVGSGTVFQCNLGDPNQPSHFAFNSKLDGRQISKVPRDTVMIFETTGGWNQSGGPELMLTPSRHGGKYVVAFVDGSVQSVTAARLPTLRWEPE